MTPMLVPGPVLMCLGATLVQKSKLKGLDQFFHRKAIQGEQSHKLILLASNVAAGSKKVSRSCTIFCIVHLGRGLRGDLALGRGTRSTYQVQFPILEPDMGIQCYFWFGA